MRRLMLLALAGAVVAGCGSSESSDETEPAAGSSVSTTSAGATGSEGDDGSDPSAAEGRIYFTAGEQLQPEQADAPDPVVAARELLRGPDGSAKADTSTQIPAETKLKAVKVDGRTATVYVSGEFRDGVPADPSKRSNRQQAQLDARLAQMTYTVTDFDDVDRAKVVSGGVDVGPARDRKDFEKPEPKAPKEKLGDPKPKGRESSSVRSVQKRLADLKYLPKGAVDGIDGYRTRQAVMAFQAWEGLQRDGIAGPQTTAALASAKRPRPKSDGPSRRLEVYRDKGVTLVVKHDRTKRAIHTSSGGPGYTTPAGRFEVFRKEVNSWSVPYQTWLPWASYFNAGIAFHAYPDVPAYPASHGCVRVPEPEAEHLYDFARIGTAVIVR